MAVELVEVGEVGQARQADNRDVEHALPLAADGQAARERVLVVEVDLEHGDDAGHGQAREALEILHPGTQDLGVSAELVDDEALDHGAVCVVEQPERAVELGEDAARVDVAREQHRRAHHVGHAHVDEVVLAQVDLGGAAGPLDDDDVGLGGKLVIAGTYIIHELALVGEVLARLHRGADLSPDDDLTAAVALGLEKDRVHPHVRVDAGRLGLHGLGSAELEAVCGDGAVERHVLALEGAHPIAVLREDPAEPGDEHALAGV